PPVASRQSSCCFLGIPEIAQPLAVANKRPMAGLPSCASKETSAVQSANLRGCATDHTADRFRAPNQIALLSVGFGRGNYGRIILNIVLNSVTPASPVSHWYFSNAVYTL